MQLQAGNLLIAHPRLAGSIFEKSVIYIYQHCSYGTNGLIINKSSPYNVQYLFECKGDRCDSDESVLIGGAINTRSISMLHTDEFNTSNTLHLNNGVALSSDELMFEKVAMGNCPKDWKLITGMCGWASKQLEQEIDVYCNWLVLDSHTTDLIFNYSEDNIWHKALDCYSKNLFDSYF